MEQNCGGRPQLVDDGYFTHRSTRILIIDRKWSIPFACGSLFMKHIREGCHSLSVIICLLIKLHRIYEMFCMLILNTIAKLLVERIFSNAIKLREFNLFYIKNKEIP